MFGGYIFRSWTAGSLGSIRFKNLFKEAPYCFPQWVYQHTFSPTASEGSLFSTSSSTLTCRFLMMATVIGIGQHFTVVLICISLISRDAELLSMFLLTISMFSLENVCSSLFTRFWLKSVLFLDIDLREMYCFLKHADFYLKGKSAMLPPPHLSAEGTNVALCLFFIKRQDWALTAVEAVVCCPDCLRLGRRHPCPRCWEHWRLMALRGLSSAIETQLTRYPLPGGSLRSMTVHVRI